MTKSRLLTDFSTLLAERGYEIANEAAVSQEPSDNYSFAEQIFNCRDVLVPFLCKLALGIKDHETPIVYSLAEASDMNLVLQYLKGIVNQFLENLEKKNLVRRWNLKEDLVYEIEIADEERERRFFRSEWAELVFRRVILKTVQSFCSPRGLSCKTFFNVELRRPGEETLFTELDLVVQVQKRFYVFEIKSGPWINIIQWAKRDAALVRKNGPVRDFVCTVYDNIPAHVFEPQRLLNLGNVETELLKVLKEDFPK